MSLRSVIVFWKNTRMDSNSEDEPNESKESTTQTPQSKLRDLKPEKDPMGSGLGADPRVDVRGFRPGAK